MATLEQYAQWLVNNKDKKGTPDFETVASAYKALRSQGQIEETFIQPKPEEQSVFRSIADVPLAVGRGAVQGVRMIAEAFGAGNPVAESLVGVEGYIGDLMSAQSKADAQEVSRIMKEAEDKGLGAQLGAALKALTVAPVDLVSQALGTAAPMILGGLAGVGARGVAAGRALTAAEKASTASGVSTGLGATMGAGVVKGTIYSSVKDALMEAGQDEATAEAKAQEAQAYGGENWGSILAGTVLGGVAGRTGVEKMILGRFAAKEGAEQALLPAAGRGAVTEAVPEAVQAGQEKMAENIALQKFADETGEEVPLFRGVAGQAALEGLVGGALGAGVGATTRTRPALVTPTGEPTEPQITEEQRIAAGQVNLGDALAQARAGVTDVGTDGDTDYQAYMAGQTATPATPTAPVTEKPKRGKKAKVELSAEEQKAVDAYNTAEVAAQAEAQKAAIDEQLSLDQEAEAEARQDAREGRARYGAGETLSTPQITEAPVTVEPSTLEIERKARIATAGEFNQIQPPQPLIDLAKKVREADEKANYPAAKATATKLGRRLNGELETFARQVLGRDPSNEDIGKLYSRVDQFIDPSFSAPTETAPETTAAVTAKEESLADKKERLKQAKAARNKVAKGQLDIGETYAQTDEGVALDNEIAQLEDETRMIETYERTRQTLGKSEKNKPWEDLSADEKMVYEDALGTNIVYDETTKEGIVEGLEDIVLGAIGELTAYRKSKGEGKGKKNTAIAAYEINRKAESNYRGINLPRWNLLPEPAKKAFLDKVFSPEESSPSYAGPTYEVQQAGFDAVQELVKEEFATERPELEAAATLKESEAAAQRRVRAEEETEELSLKQKLPEDIVQIIKEPVKGGDTGQKTEKVLEYLRKNAKGVYKGKVKGLLFDYSGLVDKVTSKMNRLVAGSLSGLGLKTKMQYVDTNDFIAYYDAKTDTVYVGNRGLNETAVLHELVHAATVKVISDVKNGTEKNPQRIEAVKRLEALMAFSKKDLGQKYSRAYKNVYEFIAYAMTDPKFQAELQKLTAPGHLIKYSDIRDEPALTAEQTTGLPIKGTFAEKKSEQAEPVSYSALGDNPNNLYAAFVEAVADVIGLFRRAATVIKSIGVPAQFFEQGRTKSAKEVEEDLELSEDDKAEIAEEMGERAKNIRKEGRVYNPLIKKADDLNGRYTKHLADQRLAEERLVKEAQAEFGAKGPKAKDFDALRKLVNAKPEMIRFRQEGNQLRTEIEKLNKELRDADLEDFEIEETVGDKKYGVMYSVTPGALGNLFLEVAGAFDTIIAAPPEGGIPAFTVGPLYVGAPQQTPEQQAQAEKERLINKTENDQTSSFKRFGGVMRNIFTKQGYNDLVRKVQNRTREFVLLERNLTRLGIANWVGDKINTINTVYNSAIGVATNKSNEFKEFNEGAMDAIRNIMRLQGKKYSEVLADLQMYMTGLHDHERRMELFYRNVTLTKSASTQRDLIYKELRSDALGKLRSKSAKAADRRVKELKNKLILLATDRSNFEPGLSAEKFDPNSDEYNPLSYPAAVAAIFRDTYKDASSEVKAELEKLFGTDTKPGFFKQIIDKSAEVNAEANYFTAPVQNVINFYGYKHYFPFKGRGGDTDKQDKVEYVDPFMSERLGNDFKQGEATFMGRQTAADNPVLQIFTESTKASMRFGFKDVPIAMKNLLEQKIVAGSSTPKIKISFEERSAPGFKFADAGVKQYDFFVYKDDGSIDVYEINDPNMRRAFKGIYEDSSPIIDLLNKVTSTIGAMHTRYNPAFAPLDFTRNLMTYAGLLGSKYGPKAAGQMYAAMAGVVADGGIHKTFKFSRLFSAGNIKEMEALAKSDPYYADVKEYYDRGGQVAYMDGLTNSQALTAVAKKLSANKKFNLENFQNFMDAYMAMFEITSRVAAFRILKRRFVEEGMDPESAGERAMGEAKDLANFQQVGEIGRGLGAFFMFWRPAATGAVKAIDEVVIPALEDLFTPTSKTIERLTEYYKTRPGATPEGVQKAVRDHLEQRKNARYMASILFGAGAFTYLMAYTLAGEDDEGRNKVLTDDPSRWVRFARINLGVQENGRDLVFQIPWGFGPGALASAGAQVMATAFGAQNPMQMGVNLVQAGSESFVPLPVSKIDPTLNTTAFIVDSVMPSTLRPLLQFAMNTDGLGRKIYTDRQSRFADAYLGGDNVPEIYKDMAKNFFEMTNGAVDISPGTAYFLANNYVDGVSRVLATSYNLTDVIKGQKEFDVRTDTFLLDTYFKAPSNYDAIQFSKAESKIKEMEKKIKSLEGTEQYADYLESNPMAPATVKYYNQVVNGQLRNLRQRANEIRRSDLSQKEKTELLQLLTKQQNQIKMAFVNALEGLETAYTGYEE